MVDHLILVVVPMLLSNTIHMLVVKYNFLKFLNIPIASLAFGENKTWRGFFILPFLNGIFMQLLSYFYSGFNIWFAFILGFCMGVAYLIFELPNSYIKRRLGIAPGERPVKNRILFTFGDRIDSAIGVLLVYYIFGMASFIETIITFIIGVLLHLFFSWLLVLLKIKRSI